MRQTVDRALVRGLWRDGDEVREADEWTVSVSREDAATRTRGSQGSRSPNHRGVLPLREHAFPHLRNPGCRPWVLRLSAGVDRPALHGPDLWPDGRGRALG